MTDSVAGVGIALAAAEEVPAREIHSVGMIWDLVVSVEAGGLKKPVAPAPHLFDLTLRLHPFSSTLNPTFPPLSTHC